MPQIITFGFLVTDVLLRPVGPDIFTRDSTHLDHIHLMSGGDAGNVALNAADLGIDAALVTAVGDDDFGRILLSRMKRRGVDISCAALSKTNPTATSIVLTREDGERNFLSNTDIFAEISGDMVTDELMEGAVFLSMNSYYRMAQMGGEATARLFARARAHGLRTVLDCKFCRSGDPLALIAPALRQTDIFLPSYDEAAQITGRTDPREMAEVIRPLGVPVFIVKMGEKGSFVFDLEGGREMLVPAFRADRVVSTVGAGDTYCAGLMAAMVRGMDLFTAARFASAAASLTVRVEGASGGISSYDEVLQMI